ncbi:beta-1,4-mannosyl-glycoprotein 4-beta-N-acetylglucosaminyltransferase [Culex pipiens pallens]|uniref:beta-1,4-mannosyl-glycoprotein 4-beta-N-acetylglucosaminyltransferase n=1 Tax=Culex pipiens pallens TaxID=42434 RepID=UPI001952BFF9|nr:beta-1,4-mannosyl-glycoprotein 4-beta-N-acetylglucosaminyltransferase [Culex pipiens pallens]
MQHPKVDVKLFLWGLFLLQIFLISVFLAFGSLLASNIHQDDLTTAGGSTQAVSGKAKSPWFNVKFILEPTSDGAELVTTVRPPGPGGTRMRHPRFRPLQLKAVPKPDNYTKYYRWIYYHDGYREQRRLCFIEGTHFPVAAKPATKPQPPTTTTNETDVDAGGAGEELAVGERRMEESEDEDNEVNPDGRCRCKAEWHGPDCGQPEVLWRAFIASRIPPRNQTAAPRKIPKGVFYVIDTTFISVEVLEMQMMELVDVVSMFVLCDRQLGEGGAVGGMKKDAYSIGDHLKSTDFLRENLARILLVEDVTCSGRNVLRKMRKFIGRGDLHGEDVLLYSRTDEILNRRAVNYFRWYDNWPQPVRFRLKYNVFGFFWQHPASTLIGGAACQLSTVDEVYRSDPERLLRIEKPVMLIGDLNHYGGWYCRHCYQPIDIVKYLEFIALVNTTESSPSAVLPDPKKATVMDAEYVQNLIASGRYFGDEALTLSKLQRHVDKYYAPEYVRKNSWRFDNVVINLFARWEDSVIDDEYFS